MTPTPIIKWAVLGQILWVSLVSGLGIVGLASLGMTAFSRSRADGASEVSRVGGRALAALSTVAALTVVGWGIYLITHKA